MINQKRNELKGFTNKLPVDCKILIKEFVTKCDY